MLTETHTGLDSPEGHLVEAGPQVGEALGRIAFGWCMVLFAMMPLWHLKGGQNPSGIRRRVEPAGLLRPDAGVHQAVPDRRGPRHADRRAAAGQRRLPGGDDLPVDADPASCSRARSTSLHLSSLDVNHGFSLYPLNVNFQVVPGLRLRPAGDADRGGRLPDHLQRVLRHRPPHHGRPGHRRGRAGRRRTVRRRHREATDERAPSHFRTCPVTGRTIHLRGRAR